MSYVVGIDPGVSGAIALLNSGRVMSVIDMPVLAAEGSKGRRILDAMAIVRLFRNLMKRTDGQVRAVLEEVRSLPRDGHVGAFSFGRGYGVLETALAAAGMPYRTVRPQVWKRVMGVTADKDQARAIATRMMPAGAVNWQRKKDDGRAEAALIALYGERHG